jgi:hypothetical protein
MPKRFLKTGKGMNKFLAGAGIASIGALVLGAIAPGLAGSTAGKAIEGIAAYGVGGVESLAGAVVPMFLGSTLHSFSGSTALDNVQTESL